MTMTTDQLMQALKSLRLSGMAGSLEVRAMQVNSAQMNFMEGVSWLVQDELDRRQSRLLDRRFIASGLTERKALRDFDWGFNPTPSKKDVLELATLKFIDNREDVLFLGKPGTGKSHIAKAIALQAVERGYKVAFRTAHALFESLHEARQIGTIKKCRAPLLGAQLLVIDDLFLRKFSQGDADELADILMSRYEQASTIITSNRPIEDWSKLLGDVVVVTPLLDRLMHHGHLMAFEGKSWRLKEAAERTGRTYD